MAISQHLIIAFTIRMTLLFGGEFMDVNSTVKYTDIDYNVYSDAAHYLWHDGSPYSRQAYRYSPILAAILTPNVFLHESFGKMIFAMLDIFTGYLIYKVLKRYTLSEKTCQLCSLLWFYNPINAVVSTRGSADSINTALMLSCIQLLLNKQHALLGLTFGFSVHFRLYPIMYSIAFYSSLSDFPSEKLMPWKKFLLILYPNKKKVILVLFTLIGFVCPTTLFYYIYGTEFIEEAFLYHLYRKDIKHNFSPYFYLMYLMEQSPPQVASVLAFVPLGIQLLLILIIAWVFCTKEYLPVALFLQTYIFVTFNKVCTSQYFLWYLSFFAINVAFLRLRVWSIISIITLWFLGQVLWLLPAYYLEFNGINTYSLLWISGLTNFLLNVYLACSFCKAVPVLECDENMKKSE